MADAARRIRAQKPSVNIIFYKNSVLDWNDYNFHAKLLSRPELWAKQASGQPARTRGDGHFARAEPQAGMLSVDFGLEAGRDFWTQEVLNQTNGGDQLFDGVFADRAGSVPKGMSKEDQATFAAGHSELLVDVQKQIKGGGVLIANNAYIPGLAQFQLQFDWRVCLNR